MLSYEYISCARGMKKLHKTVHCTGGKSSQVSFLLALDFACFWPVQTSYLPSDMFGRSLSSISPGRHKFSTHMHVDNRKSLSCSNPFAGVQ